MRTNLCLIKIQPQSVEIQPNLRFISTCGRLNDRLSFNLPDCHSAGARALDLPFGFKLFNKTGDTLLHISFSATRITFKDYARRSLGDGRGKKQTVDMNFNRSVTYGDTVSIHHYVTDSEFGRYQILLNGITVYHFDKRVPGAATHLSYTRLVQVLNRLYHYWGPDSWDVDVYQIGDLLPEDRLALVRGR